MTIYNKDKTKILEEYDLEKGYLKDDFIIKHHDAIKEQEEKGYFKTIKTYPNGGKDVEWVVEQPFIQAHEAYNEEIPIQVYVPYSEKELELIEIDKQISYLESVIDINKQKLAETDYEAIKYAEGWFTEEEYAPIKSNRETFRVAVRDAYTEISTLMKRVRELQNEEQGSDTIVA